MECCLEFIDGALPYNIEYHQKYNFKGNLLLIANVFATYNIGGAKELVVLL